MSMKIDYDEITKLVSFLEEKHLTQFELEVEGFKIKISRGAAQSASPRSQRRPRPGRPSAAGSDGRFLSRFRQGAGIEQ